MAPVERTYIPYEIRFLLRCKPYLSKLLSNWWNRLALGENKFEHILFRIIGLHRIRTAARRKYCRCFNTTAPRKVSCAPERLLAVRNNPFAKKRMTHQVYDKDFCYHNVHKGNAIGGANAKRDRLPLWWWKQNIRLCCPIAIIIYAKLHICRFPVYEMRAIEMCTLANNGLMLISWMTLLLRTKVKAVCVLRNSLRCQFSWDETCAAHYAAFNLIMSIVVWVARSMSRFSCSASSSAGIFRPDSPANANLLKINSGAHGVFARNIKYIVQPERVLEVLNFNWQPPCTRSHFVWLLFATFRLSDIKLPAVIYAFAHVEKCLINLSDFMGMLELFVCVVPRTPVCNKWIYACKYSIIQVN